MVYNDFNHGSKNGWQAIKSDRVFQLVSDLKARDCGIDAVGFQMHENINYSDRLISGLAENMKRYHDIGIKVHITELDIKCSASGLECKWTDAMRQKQADVYAKIFKTCISQPNCVSITTWGYTDAKTWISPSSQEPLPFDKFYGPKSAVFEIINTLNSYDRNADAVKERLEFWQ